jgi:hypothetical protein
MNEASRGLNVPLLVVNNVAVKVITAINCNFIKDIVLKDGHVSARDLPIFLRH